MTYVANFKSTELIFTIIMIYGQNSVLYFKDQQRRKQKDKKTKKNGVRPISLMG